jgi:hypothetical protein
MRINEFHYTQLFSIQNDTLQPERNPTAKTFFQINIHSNCPKLLANLNRIGICFGFSFSLPASSLKEADSIIFKPFQ